MNKRLTIQIDNVKSIKDSQDNDVNVIFSLTLPWGAPYDLTFSALDEIVAELKEMQRISDEQAKEAQEKAEKEEVITEVAQ